MFEKDSNSAPAPTAQIVVLAQWRERKEAERRARETRYLPRSNGWNMDAGITDMHSHIFGE